MPSAGMCVVTPSREELNISLVKTTEIHNINNCMVFVEHCKVSSVAASAIGILGGNSRSSG